MTLVELLVSVGLFGVLALALSQVFVGFMRQNTAIEREIDLNDDLRGFHDRIDMELANMTQLIACSCGSNTCVYDDTASTRDCGSASAPCGTTLLVWETESSQTPSQVACDSGIPWGRGCKAYRKLVVTPSPTGGATPGTLEIQDASTQATLAKIVGVTQIFCGRNAAQNTTSFKIRVRAKSKVTNSTAESWNSADPTGTQGIHRELQAEVNLRNLSMPGLYFGKSSTQRNCMGDGATGTAATCCSGYHSSASGECLSKGACIRSNSPPTSTADSCCSHQLKTGTSGAVCL